jgi:hypothetical protein
LRDGDKTRPVRSRVEGSCGAVDPDAREAFWNGFGIDIGQEKMSIQAVYDTIRGDALILSDSLVIDARPIHTD